jgi:hypothetical protein
MGPTAANDIQVVELPLEEREILRFLTFSEQVYNGDPLWVAPPLMDLKLVFTPRNPLFDHAEMKLWMARRGGREVGRIAGVWDREHNRVHQDQAVFFGYFESIDDPAVTQALLNTVEAWGRKQGAQHMLGPVNPTMNDECGLLVDGFDTSPVFMMTYNPKYYIDLIEGAGFTKAKDLLAFQIKMDECPMERLGRIAGKVRRRFSELDIRPVRRGTLDQDLVKVKEVYNAAWEDNWGFVPMTDKEIDFLAERLRPLFMEGLIWLVEDGDEPVAFLLALPDYNVALKPLRGRFLTPKILGFIPYLLGLRYPPRSRVLTLGVKNRYRGKGLESVMLFEGLKTGFSVGFTEAEASWILEDNVAMVRMLEVFGARAYKTYRIYERPVNGR